MLNLKLNDVLFWSVVVIAFFLAIDPVFASDAAGGMGGSGLPWESPLDRLRRSISGPIAFTLALTGVVIGGGRLVIGGEIGEFTRTVIFIVLVGALIVFANQFINIMFSGATI